MLIIDGYRILLILEVRGMKFKEFAAQSGLESSTLKRIAAGLDFKLNDAQTLNKLCKVLNESATFLVKSYIEG